MATATLSPTVASIRSAKPTYVYGATARIQLITNAAQGLVRIGMPSDIPANAVVSSAVLTFYQFDVFVGSKTLTVQRQATAWKMSTATWNNRGSVSGTAVNVTQSGTADRTAWAFTVTTDVQAWINGTVPNYGWRLSSNSATNSPVRGSAATYGKPVLVITYVVPAKEPTNLIPAGNQAVSVAKPVLTFQAPPDMTHLNVQIDADTNSPYDFDSGDVASSTGVYDSTAAAAWAGLTAGGASGYWRVRTKSALGYSAWSTWAQWKRVAKPTVTITSPGATSDDTSPPVVWTVSGGTQTASQVVIRNAAGAVLADSGRVVGTGLTYTPPKAVTTLGSSATIEVRVWDAVDRVAVPGDTAYAVQTQTFTAAGTGAVTPASTCTAVANNFDPSVVITATRGAAPDSWTLYRNDGKGETIVATGLSPASASFSYTDWSADPNKSHVYRAAPYTSGTGTASGGPTATVTNRCTGIWLVDPATPAKRAVIWGDEAGDFDAGEIAVLHQPLAAPPVRRVAYRPPLSGSCSGELVDAAGQTADAQITNLYDFKQDDRDLRLILGDRNMLVRVGDLTISPTPASGTERYSLVTFVWWQQDSPPWEPT